jgi:hypothetical protein
MTLSERSSGFYEGELLRRVDPHIAASARLQHRWDSTCTSVWPSRSPTGDWQRSGTAICQDEQHIYSRNLEVPSGGGVGTARAIAHAYSAFARDVALRDALYSSIPAKLSAAA